MGLAHLFPKVLSTADVVRLYSRVPHRRTALIAWSVRRSCFGRGHAATDARARARWGKEQRTDCARERARVRRASERAGEPFGFCAEGLLRRF